MKFDTPTLISLTAPTCSGKSYLLNGLVNTGLCSRIVSTTTRARRSSEIEGVDYYFISEQQSRQMESDGKFFELVTFRGTRYGVTHDEMRGKMTAAAPPIIILEPQGVAIYERLCHENGWNIFKAYVHVIESLRVKRLNERTCIDIRQALNRHEPELLDKIVAMHTDRLLSITTEERAWSNTNKWDVIIPGDNTDRAVADLQLGVVWRNKRLSQLVEPT